YLLSDFDETRLTEAIRKPTDFAKYAFRFAEGVVEKLAREVVEYCRNRQDSVLPLAQVICTQLHQRLPHRGDRVIRIDDVKAIGGLEGGIQRHVETVLSRHLPPNEHDAFRRLLSRLYLRQPDGTLTTALMPVKDRGTEEKGVEHYWRGCMSLEKLLD